MTEKSPVETALADIEDAMRGMLAGELDPYDSGSNIWAKSMSLVEESPEVMHPFWLIWGALTDWVETRPDEKGQADATMLRAAKEWLELDSGNDKQRDAYLHRWVFEEMGYRPNT